MKKVIKKYTVEVVEEVNANYVIPCSNFSGDDGDKAFLIGIPCEVISDPYMKTRKNFWNSKTERIEVIDVKSCVTGLKYTIPNDWVREFATLEEANEESKIMGMDDPHIEDIIGANYYPNDNSYIRNFDGKSENLHGKTCKVVSAPFKDKNEYGKVRDFILVEYKGTVYRTLWEEWCLYPRS